MAAWKDQVAIVTGGASGIGASLTSALLRRGARLVLVDMDAEGLAALSVPPEVERHTLDVRDHEGMRRLAVSVARRHGRIDYLFNNAWVGVGGEVQYLTVGHWDRAIDISIRGVVNGIAAVYPIMVRQRSGTIVNTASMAGLGPLPLLVPYNMTKHAIVGLTRGLRMEAEAYGVRVCALCPVGVETPMLDAANPADLPNYEGIWRPDLRRYFTRLVGRPMHPDRFAEQALRGVERNRGLIVVPRMGLLRWYGSRTFTSVAEVVVRWAMNRERRAAAAGELPTASAAAGTSDGMAPDPLEDLPPRADAGSSPASWPDAAPAQPAPVEPAEAVVAGSGAGQADRSS